MAWANEQADGVPEKYQEDEVLWSAHSLLEKLSDWQGVKGGSMQSCCLGAGLRPVPTVRCRKVEEDRGWYCHRDNEYRITPSALTPQRIGLGMWD